MNRQRLYAGLVAVGASILLARTVIMMAQDALAVLVPWVAALLVIEFGADMVTLAAALRWLAIGTPAGSGVALPMAVTVTLLHVFRVLIFVLGRVGPWVDFDVLPGARAAHAAHWSWSGLWIAALLSVLAVIVVAAIWLYRRRRAA